MSTLRKKLTNLLTRGTRVRALEEEMRTHLDMLVEENLRRGMDAVEARRRAHLAFGNLLATREEATDALGWPVIESWVHDARVAWRSLARRPAFALSLVLILALGIGVTTAIFSLLRGVLWESLPVDRPAELHLAVNPRGEPFLFSMPALQRLRDSGFPGRVIGYSGNTSVALRLVDAPAEQFRVQFVQSEFFTALQLGMAQGRALTPADDQLGTPRPVAVVSYHWWKRRLNADPAAVGRPLRLNGVEVVIVGIAPEAFTGVVLGDGVEAWLPAGLHAPLRATPSAMTISRDDPPKAADWVSDDRVAWMNLLLRVPPGTAAQGAVDAAWQPQLQSALDVFGDPTIGGEFARNKPRLVPSPQGFSSARDNFRRVGLTLSLLVATVVLVTAANSATLLLLRMLSRTRELGVRLALGAGRWRLARGALMEGLLLSLAGAGAGLLLGLWLTPLVGGWLVPGAVDALPGLDFPLVGALASFAVLLGVALGAVPAWISTRLAPQSILHQRSSSGGGSLRIGRSLIVLQLALSVMLIAVAGALALDLRRVLNSNLGYARTSVLGTFFDFDAAGIEPAAQPAVLARLRAAAETLPQVKAVGFAASGVLSGSQSASGSYFRGAGVKQPTNNVQTESIDEHYFSALGMALVRGRNFTAADTEKAPRVAIVSQRLAREVFGDADPIGRRFGFDQNAADNDWEIIGIAPDARINGVRTEAPAMYYVPLTQWRNQAGCLVVRVAGDAAAVKETLSRTVAAAEPGLMFSKWFTLEERVQRWLRDDLAAVRLTAGFGVLALLLAVIGVLGALGYLVASRSREIAVRLAIGAAPRQIWGEIVRDALRLGVAGAVLGLALAVALPRVLSSWMMTGLQTDWVAISAAALVGLGAAALGGLLPARRAARVDPLTLLRSE